MKKVGFILIMCLCTGFFSCKKQAPQIPSNKIVVDNTEAKTLLDINQNLALKEDSLLEIFVQKNDKSFIKNEIGFWYKIEQAGNGPKVTNKSTCNFTYRLALLNGKIVEKGKKQIGIGKKQKADNGNTYDNGEKNRNIRVNYNLFFFIFILIKFIIDILLIYFKPGFVLKEKKTKKINYTKVILISLISSSILIIIIFFIYKFNLKINV